MKRPLRTLFVAALLIVGSSVGEASAYASTDQPNPDSLTPDELRSQYTNEQLFYSPEIMNQQAESSGESITLRGGAYVVQCTVNANAPHISVGAGGVIYKTRVTCTGTGDYPAEVHILVKTALYHIPADDEFDTDDVNWRQYYNAQAGRDAAVNGATQTFYSPWEGLPGFKGKGFWQGTSIVDIIDPVGWKSGNDTSKVMFLNSP